MIGWALIPYYVALFLIPWGVAPGYEVLYRNAGRWLGMPDAPDAAYAVMLALVFTACALTSALLWAVLRRDDARWNDVRALIGRAGWLGWLDAFLPFLLVGVVAYAWWNAIPLHGVLAAIGPALVALGASGMGSLATKKETRPALPEDAPGAALAPVPAGVSLNELFTQARVHAGSTARRDTIAKTVLFRPPRLGVHGLADPSPRTITWVVTRDEVNEALEEAPDRPLGELPDAALVRLIRDAASHRTLSILGEQVAGIEAAALEDRAGALRAFISEQFEPIEKEGRPRTPVTCLADGEAAPDEARALLIALALGLRLPVALWRGGTGFGLAVEGIPEATAALPGREFFDPRTHQRFFLADAPASDVRIVRLPLARRPART